MASFPAFAAHSRGAIRSGAERFDFPRSGGVLDCWVEGLRRYREVNAEKPELSIGRVLVARSLDFTPSGFAVA